MSEELPSLSIFRRKAPRQTPSKALLTESAGHGNPKIQATARMAAGLAPADRRDEPRATALQPRALRRVSVRRYPLDGATSHRPPRQGLLDLSTVLHTIVDNRRGRDPDRHTAPGLPQGPEFQGQAAITAARCVPVGQCRYEEWLPPVQP